MESEEFEGIGAVSPAPPEVCPDYAALPWQGPERLYLWFLHHDGSIAATLQETGGRRHVTPSLPAIAAAIVATGAPCLFMAHSHPSGDPRPSIADIEATRQIWRLARTLGASLQDHLVIGHRRVFSFRASGLL